MGAHRIPKDPSDFNFNTLLGFCAFAWGEPTERGQSPHGFLASWARDPSTLDCGAVTVLNDAAGPLMIVSERRNFNAKSEAWYVLPEPGRPAKDVILEAIEIADAWVAEHDAPLPGWMIRVEEKDKGPGWDPATSWVYFVQAGEGGPIKIGRSADLEARVSALQTANANVLRVIGKYPGRSAVERGLHTLFAKYRTRDGGEWFHPSPELMAFIREVGGR